MRASRLGQQQQQSAAGRRLAAATTASPGRRPRRRRRRQPAGSSKYRSSLPAGWLHAGWAAAICSIFRRILREIAVVGTGPRWYRPVLPALAEAISVPAVLHPRFLRRRFLHVTVHQSVRRDLRRAKAPYRPVRSTAVPVPGYADGHAVLPAACG
jgi:hypothetical protein